MTATTLLYVVGALFGLALLLRARARWLLSRAKHPSLRGHARIASWFAKQVPYYEYGEDRFFDSDGAPDDVVQSRRRGFERLASYFERTTSRSVALTDTLARGLSDAAFTSAYRVPFQYRRYLGERMRLGSVLTESKGMELKDADGNWSYDLSGSYGVNVFGNDFYKECIDAGAALVRDLGPVLGAHHPLVLENVAELKRISGLDEVSFHMSGTEAVMQAVRLARFHTRRSHIVRFCGAYHGWWDGVQPGIGNPRPVRDVYTLRDMDERTLRVLRTRRDIACVLVNPLQALHPNATAPSDATLLSSDRLAGFDRGAYRRWLRALREVCTERSIPLVFDEVFLGFRLALGGAQEYFGVRADLVTYGKTLGGGLPVGVVCGTSELMKRYRDDRPTDICFARGTFNSHPYVMGAMNVFLDRIREPEVRASYGRLDDVWSERAREINRRLMAADIPIRVENLSSIWTTYFLVPSRYNWMLQYYLRAEGLAVPWTGTGRFVFAHNCPDDDFEAVARRIVSAAQAMRRDGWWWTTRELTNQAIRRQVFREMVAAYRR